MCGAGAGITVLNVHDNDDLGIFVRGIGYEPRVVLKVQIGTLRRSRFRGDGVLGLAELFSGGTVVFNLGNFLHALVDGGEVGSVCDDLVGDNGLLVEDDVSFGIDDLVDNLRVVYRASVCNGRGVARDGDGGNLRDGLTDAGHDGFGRRPLKVV